MDKKALANFGFIETDKTVFVKNFYDINDFLDVAGNYKGWNARSAWAGGTYEEVLNRVNYGSFENTGEFFRAVENIKTGIFENSKSYKRNYHGDFLDVSTFLSGDMECFFTETQSPQKETIKICVQIGYSYKFTQAEIINRGACICALVDSLQNAGYYVDLTLVNATKTKRTNFETYTFYIPVNCNPVDLDLLSAVTCDSGFCRQLVLGFIDNVNKKCNLKINDGFPMAPLYADNCNVLFTGYAESREYFQDLETTQNTYKDIMDKLNTGVVAKY